jgi:hypothetical protein
MRRLEVLFAALLAMVMLALPQRALAEGEEVEGYAMNDLRATVYLPEKWEVLPGGWSDWDFRCKSAKGDMEMRLWMTPFQVEPSQDAADAWIKLHSTRLTKHQAENIESTRTEITQLGGRPTVEMDLSFVFEGGKVSGVYQAVAMTAYGKVIHAAIMSNDRNAAQAREVFHSFLEKMEVQKEAEDIAANWGKGVSPAGFEHSLPDGWRTFGLSEMGPVAELAKKTGQGRFEKDLCWAAIRPVGGEVDPDFMIFCEGGLLLDKVDEYSWDGIEPTVRNKFFGNSSLEVEQAERIVVGDRLGFIYSPPSRGAETLMAVAPYESGKVMVGWARAGTPSGSVDDAFRGVLSSSRFTGPNGGEQPIGGIGGWFVYSIRYRPTNPLFIGPVVLVLLGFLSIIVILARHKPKELEDY